MRHLRPYSIALTNHEPAAYLPRLASFEHSIFLIKFALSKAADGISLLSTMHYRKVCQRMNGGRSLIGRRRGNVWIRSGVMVFIVLFVWMQLTFLSVGDSSDSNSSYNDSNAAILSMVPSVLHKFLTPRPRNSTQSQNRSSNSNALYRVPLSIPFIKRNIAQYNLQQTVYNEDIFGPLQNDSVVIVVQVCIAHTVTLRDHSTPAGRAMQPNWDSLFLDSW